MKFEIKWPVSFFVLGTPLLAHADSAPGTGVLYAFAGGFAGGMLGALMACWLCKRKKAADDNKPPRS